MKVYIIMLSPPPPPAKTECAEKTNELGPQEAAMLAQERNTVIIDQNM